MDSIAAPRILVYQSEEFNLLTEYLQLYNFIVIEANNSNVDQLLKEANFDLCILDHFTSIKPGDLRLLKKLRTLDDRVPIIMVSYLKDYNYIIQAFDEGADDYIIKPFNLDELTRRINAVLKRCGIKTRTIEATYEIGNYLFNTKSNSIVYKDQEIKLTKRESRMLSLLCAYKGEILPKKLIIQQLWDEDNYFSKRSLDVYICRLRNIFKDDERVQIETKRGFGYILIINNK